MPTLELRHIEVTRNNADSYKVAYWTVDAVRPGPTVLVTGAMHGNEIQSCEIIRRFKEIACAELKTGKCLLMPFANPIAVRARQAHIDFETGRSYGKDTVNNLNCTWPGKADGSDAQRLSHAIYNSGLLDQATYCIDLHCWQDMHESVVMPRADNPASMALAKASRLPFMLYDGNGHHTHSRPGQASRLPSMLYDADKKTRLEPKFPCLLTDIFLDSGKTGLIVEFSGQFLIHRRVLEQGVTALCNMFKHLGMINGELEGDSDFPLDMKKCRKVEITAPLDGLFVKAEARLGQKIKKGDLLGHLFNETTLEKHDVFAPASGWLFRCIRQQDSTLHADPLTAYHVYAFKNEVVAAIIATGN